MRNTTCRILILKEDEWWVAQCLEYDIAAQARTIKDVQYELQRVFFGRIVAAQKLAIDPFEDLAAAPSGYWKMFEDASKTLKLEFRPVNLPIKIPSAFTLPQEAILYAS